MNYWHLQMHPSNRGKFKKEKLIQILQEKEVIGMGESWTNQKGEQVSDPSDFKNQMHVDDVVLIRDGSSPIALVQVTGTWYIESNIDEDFDWFRLRRPIKLLKEYDSSNAKLKESILSEYGKNHIQAPGTLTPANNNTATNQFIKKWYLQVQKQLIMDKLNLSPERIENIKSLWARYTSSYTPKGLKKINSKIENLQKDWQYYRKKIKDGTLSLQDYTNRLENSSERGGYLCNFLERTTSEIYGSSKPGNASNFEIKLNDDNTTYTFNENLRRGDGKINHNSLEDANERFKATLKPLLQRIVNSSSAVEKIQIIEEANYAAKQILRKMAVLDSTSNYLNIYSDDAINTLHNDFLDSETSTNLGKNHEVRIAINKVLNLEDTPVNAFLVSRFLWKYATSSAVADANTPNVILYGPPGTGKTFTVRQSLDFICMDDDSRYEFITFHPSFTYEDFIDGIKPKGVTKDGNIKFELTDGVFKKFCKKALAECVLAKVENRNPKSYYFVVDEINRANLSAVFGETLMCLEKDYRYDILKPKQNLYKTQYSPLIESMVEDAKKEGKDISDLAFIFDNDNAYFGVPNNVYFIGMMNDVDKSIDAFDLALRRRFKWERMDYNQDVLEQETKFKNGDDFLNMPQYSIACTKLNEYISQTLGLGKSYEFGHSFFMKITGIANSKTISKSDMEKLFHLYLEPSLKEYLRALFSEQELDGKIKDALELYKNNLK
ncbi:restriction endonuclease [Polaribacter filamentus]|uniref:Restriction endonuclease n=1 Tax=Polaribacter filamentus TaxID=53483 RepID=A0A2S7KY06_9FLAO|nr:AAA family ATPase [Polaribacter filamentus]PQB07552.1 restriction endonuclease [Polaribacter filamentus]